ncbi:MAG: hypothetical protein ACLT4X_02790 [Phascolarctobacterium sp.]|mgnify:FL=1|jgi:hypothetical protein
MNEIFKLKELLIKADIPFEFYLEKGGYHLCYPMDGEKRVCSAIQTNFSYGHEDDLIEIMGLLTEEEREEDSVKGWLAAEEVFKRIEKHWNLFGGGKK